MFNSNHTALPVFVFEINDLNLWRSRTFYFWWLWRHADPWVRLPAWVSY